MFPDGQYSYEPSGLLSMKPGPIQDEVGFTFNLGSDSLLAGRIAPVD
jgi:hypothetical protein